MEAENHALAVYQNHEALFSKAVPSGKPLLETCTRLGWTRIESEQEVDMEAMGSGRGSVYGKGDFTRFISFLVIR